MRSFVIALVAGAMALAAAPAMAFWGRTTVRTYYGPTYYNYVAPAPVTFGVPVGTPTVTYYHAPAVVSPPVVYGPTTVYSPVGPVYSTYSPVYVGPRGRVRGYLW
jgi:hypothetical protein